MKCCTKECSFYHSFYWIISNRTIIIHPGPRYRWQTRSFSSLTTSFLSRPRPMLSSEASLSWTECSDPESVWLSGPTILDDKVRWFHKQCSRSPKAKTVASYICIWQVSLTIVLDAVSRLHPRVLTGFLPRPDVTCVTRVTRVVADSLTHQQVGHHWNNRD